MGTGHSFSNGPSTSIYCSIFPPFFHEGTRKINFYTPRDTHLWEHVHTKKQRSSWVAHKITTVLPTARQKFPRYSRDIWNLSRCFKVFILTSDHSSCHPGCLRMRITIPPLPLYTRLANRELLEYAHRWTYCNRKSTGHLNRSSTVAQASVSHMQKFLRLLPKPLPVPYTGLSSMHLVFLNRSKMLKPHNGRSNPYPRCLSTSHWMEFRFALNSGTKGAGIVVQHYCSEMSAQNRTSGALLTF
jgi:hypothetical protein